MATFLFYLVLAIAIIAFIHFVFKDVDTVDAVLAGVYATALFALIIGLWVCSHNPTVPLEVETVQLIVNEETDGYLFTDKDGDAFVLTENYDKKYRWTELKYCDGDPYYEVVTYTQSNWFARLAGFDKTIKTLYLNT